MVMVRADRHAALAAGAEGLCVALVQEGIALREAGIDAPILLLSEQPPSRPALIVEHGLTPTVYTAEGVEALVAAGGTAAPGARQARHVGCSGSVSNATRSTTS